MLCRVYEVKSTLKSVSRYTKSTLSSIMADISQITSGISYGSVSTNSSHLNQSIDSLTESLDELANKVNNYMEELENCEKTYRQKMQNEPVTSDVSHTTGPNPNTVLAVQLISDGGTPEWLRRALQQELANGNLSDERYNAIMNDYRQYLDMPPWARTEMDGYKMAWLNGLTQEIKDDVHANAQGLRDRVALYNIMSEADKSQVDRLYDSIATVPVVSAKEGFKRAIEDIFAKYNSNPMYEMYSPQHIGNGLYEIEKYNVNGRAAAVPVIPQYSNYTVRDPETYNTVIDQFDVANNPRYVKRDINGDGTIDTFCNIFAWDVTSAMGAEIPHWVTSDGTPYKYDTSMSYHDNAEFARELNANNVALWLDDHGSDYGWNEVDSAAAQKAADSGQPTIGIWYNDGGIGHVVVIRPDETGNGEVTIAQAGGSNYNYRLMVDQGSSDFINGVKYYTHN